MQYMARKLVFHAVAVSPLCRLRKDRAMPSQDIAIVRTVRMGGYDQFPRVNIMLNDHSDTFPGLSEAMAAGATLVRVLPVASSDPYLPSRGPRGASAEVPTPAQLQSTRRFVSYCHLHAAAHTHTHTLIPSLRRFLNMIPSLLPSRIHQPARLAAHWGPYTFPFLFASPSGCLVCCCCMPRSFYVSLEHDDSSVRVGPLKAGGRRGGGG